MRTQFEWLKNRVKVLNDKNTRKGSYVLYWMQQSQRAVNNPALEAAVWKACQLNLPVVVCFGLTLDYPEANLRHLRFMLQGLKEVCHTLKNRGIRFVLVHDSPEKAAVEFGKKASVIVCDAGYTRHQRAWRNYVAEHSQCRVVQVEGDVVVPVETASGKRDFAARTFRPKINKHISDYLILPEQQALKHVSNELNFPDYPSDSTFEVPESDRLDRTVTDVSFRFKGGYSEALIKLNQFISQKLNGYAENRNQPHLLNVSELSPYLHFGQISPVEIALRVTHSECECSESRGSFLEELIVRRELAINYVYFEPFYDSYQALPDWALKTLKEHENDTRDYLYSLEHLENADTHDTYWNAAMKEMVLSGYMHNTMRMYWGKKILEWSVSPEEAFKSTLYLNNKYLLDGRDPSSYAGVGWVFGLHDRAWFERPVFGKIRYMAASGLERKYNMKSYMEQIEEIL